MCSCCCTIEAAACVAATVAYLVPVQPLFCLKVSLSSAGLAGAAQTAGLAAAAA
jgi:hypothetical protein